MSLYRTLSQLPNDLPLTLGAKVDPKSAKPSVTEDPYAAWFEVPARVHRPRKTKSPVVKLKFPTAAQIEAAQKTKAALIRHDRFVDMVKEVVPIVGAFRVKSLMHQFGVERLVDLPGGTRRPFIEALKPMVEADLIQYQKVGDTSHKRPSWM